MKRTDIINHLIRKFNYQTYLEIGVQNLDTNFNHIDCDYKMGVDPDPKANAYYTMTSDDFFNQNEETFDIVFIDGLHTASQVYRDVSNSLKILNNGGVIICHDCNPQKFEEQTEIRNTKRWNGNVWESIVKLRSESDNLEIFVVDTDEGCGIIRRGNQILLDIKGKDITYENLEKYRKEWLNLISVDEFKVWLSED